MKNLLKLIFLFLIGTNISFGQNVPTGMKYQAVARTTSGEVMPNRKITMRIELKNNNQSYYAEEHQVTTNQLGLFDLVVGAGKATKGKFTEVPWSTDEIWMAVSLKDNGKDSDFSAISESKLLAVPYAYYAVTASKLTTDITSKNARPDGNTPGVPANVWSLQGNSRSNSLIDKLGTTDYQDLVFITNNIERFKITKDGDISINNNLKVGKDTEVGNDLYVKRNVYLNTVAGQTINNGAFTVANMSPTNLKGTLTVDKATWLKDALKVDGITYLNNTLNVNNMSPTNLSGILTVNKDTWLKSKLKVDGTTDLNSALKVNNSAATGLSGTLTVDQATDLNSTLNVDGTTTLKSNLTVDAVSNLNGQVTINANMPGTDQNSYDNYPLRVEGNDQGIAVKLTASTPLPGNNFMTFFDSGGNAVGRIEGSSGIAQGLRAAVISLVGTPSIGDAFLASQDKDQGVDESIPGSAADFFTSNYAFGAYQQTLDLVADIIRLITNIIGASGLCVTGDCDDVIWSAVDVIVGGLQLGGYVAWNESQTGVAFESGSADYAEWLPKANDHEQLLFGEVVGVKGGQISKTFLDAEKFMVVSNAPAIIGGAPDQKEMPNYSKIAFMGQVPVKVLGQVCKGDYILPSGKGDGMAMAVAPENMKTLDYRRVIGVAWSESPANKAFSTSTR